MHLVYRLVIEPVPCRHEDQVAALIAALLDVSILALLSLFVNRVKIGSVISHDKFVLVSLIVSDLRK